MYPSIGIEVRMEHSDVDSLIDALGGLVIFQVKDRYTLYADLVELPPMKVQVL